MDTKGNENNVHWRRDLGRERIRTIILTFIPAITMMLVIYYFSSKTAVESTETSSRVVDMLISLLKRLPFNDWDAMKTEELSKALSFPVRKCAHALEFGVLAWCFFLGIYNLVKWYPFIPAFICTFLYAATDEFHQQFVAGRAGRITDVAIDSTGAFFALLFLYFILRRVHHGRRLSEDE